VLFYTNAAQGPSGVISTKTTTLGPPNGESIATGGSFKTNAKSVGTVKLAAGTYLLNVNFEAGSRRGSV
jgi:hypothetical protein